MMMLLRWHNHSVYALVIVLYNVLLWSPASSLSLMTSSTHWNIKSAWSKAGVGTNIVLELKCHPHNSKKGNKKQKRPACVAFDIGATPCFDNAIFAKYVFLSHGHIDHVGALFSHARAHAVNCGGEAPTYFVPAQLLPQIEQCRNAMSLIDSFSTTASDNEKDNQESRKGLLKMNLVPVYPGDEFPLKGITFGSKTTFFMRAFEVDHAGHPALGYIIGSRTKSKGLKEEYQNLSGKEIRELVQSGIAVNSEPLEKIEVAYSGDTCRHGLVKDYLHSPASKEERSRKSAMILDQAFQAELLLCELTFLDSTEGEDKMKKSIERGHLHINDLHDIFSSHGRLNDQDQKGEEKSIVFYHLSARYSPAARALDYIAKGVPPQLRSSCHVAIKSLLSEAERGGIRQSLRPNGCISLEDYLSQKKGGKRKSTQT